MIHIYCNYLRLEYVCDYCTHSMGSFPRSRWLWEGKSSPSWIPIGDVMCVSGHVIFAFTSGMAYISVYHAKMIHFLHINVIALILMIHFPKKSCMSLDIWLVVWNIAYFPIQLGMSSSQLTN